MGPSPHGDASQPGSDIPKILGIVSLVAGILGIPASCCCWFLGWIPALVAIGTGAASLTQAKGNPSSTATPFAVSGLILGAIGLVLALISIVMMFTGGPIYDFDH